MRFDVEEMTKDWLVSGRKRGDFVAKARSTTVQTVIDTERCIAGWPNVRDTHYTNCVAPWGASASEGGRASPTCVWRGPDAFCDCAKLRDASAARRREGAGVASGR